jgi:hypothetical protein
MTASKQIRLCAAVSCLLFTGGLTFGQQRSAVTSTGHSVSEYEVKAGFLLNFLRFVEWPPPPAGQPKEPFSLCIIGDDPFRDILDRMVQGETVNGRAVEIRRLQRWQAPCHLLFVSASERDVFRILGQSGEGVLTVGEASGFLRDGGMISFVVDDRRVRFDINLKAASAASVKISSRLLSVARTIQR